MRSWHLIIFLYKYHAAYDKWTTNTEGNLNGLRVVIGSVLQFQMSIHH